jgi:hypothetical protein
MVTVCWPHWKVLLTFLNMVMVYLHYFLNRWEVQATPPKPGFKVTAHDAIPEPLGAKLLWNDTASYCFPCLRSKKRLS